MKLFITNKKLQGILEKAEKPYKEKIKELEKKINNKEFNYLSECSSLKERNNELDMQLSGIEKDLIKAKKEYKTAVTIVNEREKNIRDLEEEIRILKIKNRKSNSSAGGFIKQINKLQAKLDEANTKLSHRYIIKELVAEKPKKTQVMGIKSGTRTSRIIKEVVTNGK